MIRYVTRQWLDPAISDNIIEPSGNKAMTVFETEGTPRRTALLDRWGNELYAMDDRSPIGFLPLKTGA